MRVERKDWVVAGGRSGSSMDILAHFDVNDPVEEQLHCRRMIGKPKEIIV